MPSASPLIAGMVPASGGAPGAAAAPSSSSSLIADMAPATTPVTTAPAAVSPVTFNAPKTTSLSGTIPLIKDSALPDTTGLFSKFMSQNGFQAPTVSTESSTPATTPGEFQNNDNTLGGTIRNTLTGLPAASRQVTTQINNATINKASDLLSNTAPIQWAAQRQNEGHGELATQILTKWSEVGFGLLSGATAGGYQTPKQLQADQATDDENKAATDLFNEVPGAEDEMKSAKAEMPVNDPVDTFIQSASSAVGQILPISIIGKIMTPVTVVNGVTSFLSKYPLLDKYAAPYTENFLKTLTGLAGESQLNPQLGGNLQERGKTLLTNIAEAPLYTALGMIKSAWASVPASFILGFGGAKLSGASNQDAITSGLLLSTMDGIGRATATRGETPAEAQERLANDAAATLSQYGIKVTPDSTADEFKAAYHKAVHVTHPDKGGTVETFNAVKEAYDLLSKGAVSKAGPGNTPAEKSVAALMGDVKKGIETAGPDATVHALVKNTGIDLDTAEGIVKAGSAAKIEDLPAIHAATIAKVAPDLVAGGGTVLRGINLKQPTRLSAEDAAPLADRAAAHYYADKIAPAIKAGKMVTVNADDLKKYYGEDYNDNNHPVYSQAAGQIFKRALAETKSNNVVFLGGGPGSGKSEILAKTIEEQGFKGIVYDTNFSSPEGGKKLLHIAQDAGKDTHIVGMLPSLERARGFTLQREEETKRGITDNTFANGHFGFPDTARQMIENGDIPEEKVHLLDTRNFTGSLEDTKALARNGGFVDAPLATLKNLGYDKEEIKKLYAKENYTKNENGSYSRRSVEQNGDKRIAAEISDSASAKDRTNFQSGKLDVGEIVKDANAQVQDFIKKTMKPIEVSDNLSDSFNQLEGASQADLEEIAQVVDSLDITPKDDQALYAHAEDASVPLTPKQREIYDTIDKPISLINAEIYARIKKISPLPEDDEYIGRFVKDKSSVVQRIFDSSKDRNPTTSQGSVLSKSAPSLKKRTMKALTDEAGNRTVASIKDKQVTAFNNKQATALGALKLKTTDQLAQQETATLQKKLESLQNEEKILSATKSRTTASKTRLANIKKELAETTNAIGAIEDKYANTSLNGKIFTDKNGKQYTIGEATTAEIEKHTDLEYYHSAVVSRLMQYLKLRQIDRANQFLESWKESDDFAKIAVKSDSVPPEGWKMTSQANFRNYYFEPRTAEILDDMQKQMDAGQYNNAFTGINHLMADAIYFNGLAHPINVLVTHTVNRGISGLLLPNRVAAGIRAGIRAYNALATKNDDFMGLLRDGAHLMSSDINNTKVAQNFLSKLSDDMDNKPDIRDRILKALGYTLGQASFKTNVIYRLSHNMAWLSNDFLTMQSIFETMEERGISRKDAIRETARFIPDYRQKSRLLDAPLSAAGKLVGNQAAGGNTARFLAKGVVYNNAISMFGSYHVGLIESISNMIKDTAKGTDWTFSAESNAQRLQAGDKLAMLAILMAIVYPWLDKEAQKAFGPTSYITRSGITKYPYLAYKVATGETTVSQAAQQIITPSVFVWEALQQFADHDFFTGDQITGPGNEGRINHALDALAPFSEFEKVAQGKATLAEFGATLLGVHTPKNTQSAYDMNAMIYDEKPQVNAAVKAHVAAGDEAGGEALAKDFNDRLMVLIKQNDIAAGNSGDDARVQYFLNQYGLKMPGALAMQNYDAKQGQNIVQKTLPSGQPVVKKDTPLPAAGVVGVITTYAKAIGTDPVEAFELMFSGQTIRNVENGAIIVNRMSLAQSTAVKEAGGENNPDFKLDHIVPLEGGGDNSDSNLQLIPTAQWAANTNVENFIGAQLAAGNMTKDQAREIAIRYKAGQGEILSPALQAEYKDKYGGEPLTEQDVYNYSNVLDK